MVAYYTEDDVREFLLDLGIDSSYRGYDYVMFTLLLAKKDKRRLMEVSNQIFPVIAKVCGTSSSFVNKCIRDIAQVAWIKDSDKVEGLIGYKLVKGPTTKEFLWMIYEHLRMEAIKGLR